MPTAPCLFLACLITLCAIVSSALAGESPVHTGFSGDVHRSARVPDARLPIDGRVLWRSPLANWGWSQPIVVGDRVLCTYEPGFEHYFPHLVCFDARTGALLWDVELDHLDAAVGPAEAKTIREDWKIIWHKVIDGFEIINTHYKQDKALCRQKLEASGFQLSKWFDKGDELLRNVQHRDVTKERKKRCAAAGLRIQGYIDSACCLQVIGHSFMAPCSDGQAIYVNTAWGGHFAFDLDGQQLWCTFVHETGGQDTFARSPLLYDGLFIADAGNVVRALDCRTGAVQWQHEYERAGTMTSPAVLTVDGTDILIGEGMNAFRLPDGRRLTVEGWRDTGTTIVVKHDEPDVAFFSGGGEHGGWRNKGRHPDHPAPAAVRFSLAGDTLHGVQLWCGLEHDGERGFVEAKVCLAYQDGRLYIGKQGCSVIVDALKGTVLKGKPGDKRRQVTPHGALNMWLTRTHAVALTKLGKDQGQRGQLQFYDLDGQRVGTIDLEQTPIDETKRRKMARQVFIGIGRKSRADWRFSYSFPFVPHGDRLYVRSADELICIGPR